MLRKIDWENQIGRRLKLRDLHVFLTVTQRGSMAKAAQQLGVSQPAISEVIADLEHTLGVRLLDRSRQGIEPTLYGKALLRRSTAAFDELKQSIRDIEFLADPTVGELRIGCPESISSAILPQIIQRFYRQYPQVVLRVIEVVSPTLELAELHERKLDLVLARLVKPVGADAFGDDLDIDILFHDQLVVAAGAQSKWGRRRKINLAELVDEPWILTGPDTWNYRVLAEAFKHRGLTMPKVILDTFSVHLRTHLLAAGPFLTAFPHSVVRFNAERFPLKVLSLDVPAQQWPVAVVTLKNRTLSPVVERFIECARQVARTSVFRPTKI